MQEQTESPFCSVRGCSNFRSDGDSLLCVEHRKDWRLFVNTFNLDLNTPEPVIEAGLKAFKSGGC